MPNQKTVPEYVKCIRRSHAAHKEETWCGNTAQGFIFTDVSHAAENGKQQGRLVACPDCVKQIKEALDNGSEEL